MVKAVFKEIQEKVGRGTCKLSVVSAKYNHTYIHT